MQSELNQVLELIKQVETRLETELQQVSAQIKQVETRLETELQQVSAQIKQVETGLETKIDTFNERFDNYKNATQSLVNLAFGLIASATIITVVSHIFPR